jgi:predicted short-subunit dehydrogenase-like oxidoreductase (DUF2520 family)
MARTISIVGAGRVGRTLGKRLRELGWRVGAVVTRSAPTARAAMRAIGAGSAQTHLDRDTLAADVILLATPDASLAAVAKALAEVGGRECRGKVVLHTSGALDRSVLAPLARRGAATGSLHPMQTFSGRGVPQLRNVIFAVEGDPEARRVARGIARSLGGVPVIIEGRSKAAYHAAGALAAGHALALFEAATQILTKIARGDYATIAKHRKALRGYPREFQQAYAALSLLVGRVLSKAPPATLARLRRVLAER